MTKLEKLCIKWLNDNYNHMEPFYMEKYPDYIFHMKDGKCILQYNKKNGCVYVSYGEIWSFFERMFGMNYQQIQVITKVWVEEHYKMGVTSTDVWSPNYTGMVEEHYKMGVTSTKKAPTSVNGWWRNTTKKFKQPTTNHTFTLKKMLKSYMNKKPMDKKITTFINEPIETILEKPDYNSWKYYSKLLPLSREIYLEMFGKAKTHTEWADSFNKIGKINRTIIKHANGEIRE